MKTNIEDEEDSDEEDSEFDYDETALGNFIIKVEKILKSSLVWITSPSPLVKMQIMGGKVCLRWKGKTFLRIVNKLLKTKSLLTSPSNVLPCFLM